MSETIFFLSYLPAYNYQELIYKCSDFMARNLDVVNCVTVLRNMTP